MCTWPLPIRSPVGGRSGLGRNQPGFTFFPTAVRLSALEVPMQSQQPP